MRSINVWIRGPFDMPETSWLTVDWLIELDLDSFKPVNSNATLTLHPS